MAVTKGNCVIKCTAAADAVTGHLSILGFVWEGGAIAADDILNITDTAGNPVFSWTATDDDTGVTFAPASKIAVEGIIIETLTSNHGNVYIYID